MKIATLFARVRNLGARKPKVPAPRPRSVNQDQVAQAYMKFGPRVARAVARSTRAKSSSEGPSMWTLC